MGGTPQWCRGRVRNPPLEEEGAAEATCDELTINPIPCPLVLLEGRKQRKTGVELSQEGGMGGEEGVFKIWVYFSLPYSDLIANK